MRLAEEKRKADEAAFGKLVSLATRWDELNTNVQASGQLQRAFTEAKRSDTVGERRRAEEERRHQETEEAEAKRRAEPESDLAGEARALRAMVVAREEWFKRAPGAGRTEWFKDYEHGPELVVVPAYEFSMGSTDGDSEQPVHKVAIPKPFAVGSGHVCRVGCLRRRRRLQALPAG
jgi:hypothetical protein